MKYYPETQKKAVVQETQKKAVVQGITDIVCNGIWVSILVQIYD